MTIPAGSGRMDYTGNGNTDNYSFNFKIFNKNHLLVTTRDTDDVEDELTVDTDYTVSGVGEANGGSITLTAGDLTDDYHLTIRELVPIEQATDLKNQGAEYRETQEDALDYLTKIDRQQQDEIDRSFKLSETITGVSAELPVPEASKLFRWNSLATALENVSVASLGEYIPGTTMKVASNVLDLADALVAKLVTNGDSHDHSGGDGAQIDHTTVSNKGTNTHAALDTEYALTVAHRANTSNPHSVSKSQVGLGNVTNDAQVKASDMPTAAIVKTVAGVPTTAIAGTDYLTPTGDGSLLTGIVTSDSVTNITGDTTITSPQMTGRVKFYNSAQAAITLPAATVGLTATFEINHTGGIRFIRNGTDTFNSGGTASLTALPEGGTAYDIVVGGLYELTCYVAGVWTAKRKGVQPEVRAYGSDAQTLTTTTYVKVTFNDTEDYDTNADYDLTNSKLTPKVVGWWNMRARFTIQIGGGTTYGYGYVMLYKNGAEVAGTAIGSGGTNAFVTASVVLDVKQKIINTTDYFEIYYYTLGSDGTVTIPATIGSKTMYASFEAERMSD